MKKKWLIWIIVGVIVILFYLSILGIQTLSTNKKVYSQGEKIKINLFELSMYWCVGGNELQIFKQETDGWKEIQHDFPEIFWKDICLNGGVVPTAMREGGNFCFPMLIFWSDDYSWNSKIYEDKGVVDSCSYSGTNIIANRTMRSFESKNAPPGKYKIKYGIAEKIIEIVGEISEEETNQDNLVNCSKEGEMRDLYVYNKNCCDGLTRVLTCSDQLIIADKCYSTSFEGPGGCTVSTCINCGDGICKEYEDLCNCPQDCKGITKSDYNSTEEFCASHIDSKIYISSCAEKVNENEELCQICK